MPYLARLFRDFDNFVYFTLPVSNLCLTNETPVAVGSFHMVAMPVEEAYPAQGHRCDTHFGRNDKFK